MAKEGLAIHVDVKTVAAAATPEALTTRDIECSSVVIRALNGNTNPVFIVDETTNTLKFPDDGLDAGQSITIPISNPASITIRVTTNGEGVQWLAV